MKIKGVKWIDISFNTFTGTSIASSSAVMPRNQSKELTVSPQLMNSQAAKT